MPKNISLRKRDIDLLNYIGHKKWVSPEEIYVAFFEKTKKQNGNHNRRLRQLSKAQLISSSQTMEGFSLGYSLTRRGAKLLREKGFFVKPESIDPDPLRQKLSHDGVVGQVKNILMKSPLVEDFIPSYILRKKLKKSFHKFDAPDGLFTFWIGDKSTKIDLEVELFLKRRRKYEEILKNRITSKDWGEVFFVVKDEKMGEALLDYTEHLNKNNFLIRLEERNNSVYVTVLKEFLEKGLEALFYDKKIEFTLKSFEKKYFEKEKKEA